MTKVISHCSPIVITLMYEPLWWYNNYDSCPSGRKKQEMWRYRVTKSDRAMMQGWLDGTKKMLDIDVGVGFSLPFCFDHNHDCSLTLTLWLLLQPWWRWSLNLSNVVKLSLNPNNVFLPLRWAICRNQAVICYGAMRSENFHLQCMLSFNLEDCWENIIFMQTLNL